MKIRIPIIVTCTILALATTAAADWPWGEGRPRQWGSNKECCPPPYGAYCAKQHCDQYGRRQPLKTRQDAIERLQSFFQVPLQQVKISDESRFWYLADILAPSGTTREQVLIDKRTGRIRSIR